ncbi:MAG: sortase [Candidatus Promineifilaceae bacterium]
MSFNKPEEEGQTKIPLGLALMALGAIVILSAVALWAISPLNVPERLEPALVPTLAPNTTSNTAPNQFVPDLPTQEIPILLPETPLETGGLPSFAAVYDAPTSYDTTIPGQPVRLIIPKLNIDAAVHRSGLVTLSDEGQRYFQWAVPAGYAAGWHETSATLGRPGNTVLNGHNNIYGEIFRDLVDLEIGDQITLYDNAGRIFTYEVQDQELLPENGQPISVRIENAKWIEATNDERVTLVSCWPYATNSYRVVVIARPVAQPAGG